MKPSSALRLSALLLFPALLGALMGCASRATAPEGTATTPPGSTAPSKATEAPAGGGSQEVSFRTSDGWTIVGDLYAPAGASQGAVVLLHQRSGSAKDWQPLCEALQKAGIIALAIDQRGAGRSTQGPGPTGDNAPWPTSEDIAAAIASLNTTGPVGLAGASYGANNALIYAAAHPEQIKGVALFSPGANYQGLDALTPARAYRGALLIFHARGDGIAGDGPQQIEAASASSDHTLNLSDGSEHGTALLRPDTIQKTVEFFTRILKP
ncbi:MAG TPA: alpha/beta fold hydrolase [Chthonomonadaceae bacterium]|nr:alpha/beta fold hydrolase [Chthonomonadaceae bacterium]